MPDSRSGVNGSSVRVARRYADRRPAWYSGHITSVPGPTTPRWATRLSPPAHTELSPQGAHPHAATPGSAAGPLHPRAGPTSSSDWIARRQGRARRRLLILGHHYQRDEVIRWADIRGDSFKLARFAADNDQATDIVFCGVHFMAESADVLTGDHQRVILPDLNAGCSMADMADIDQVEEAWEELADVTDIDRVVPITYMNSSAALKAFVGEHGGAVCTSSNARAVLEWALGPGATRSCSSPTSTSAATPGYQMGYDESRHARLEPAPRTSAGSTSARSRRRRSCSGRAGAPCTSASAPSTSRSSAPSTPTAR